MPTRNQMKLPWKAKVKRALLGVSDRLDDFCQYSSPVAPSRALSMQYGGGNFYDTGFEFFKLLLDDVANKAILERKSDIAFSDQIDGFWTNDPQFVESAIGIKQDEVIAMFEAASLRPEIFHGRWSGRPDGVSFQDLVFGYKSL